MSDTRRALVTGAGGFVGANLVRRLLDAGHEVTATVRPGSDPWRLAAVAGDVRIEEVDLLDADGLVRVVSRTQPEWVFHLAAYGAYSWQDHALMAMRTNAVATVALVEACASSGCGAFVHAGSSSEYGFKDHAPAEDALAEPNSAYAVAKLAATAFCAQAARAGTLSAVTLRLYSAYGPFEDPRRLIPTLLAHGLRGQLPPLVAPDTARDYVAVEDVADAFLAAAAHTGHPPGAIYNIGSGIQTSVAEIVEVVRRLLSVSAEPAWGSHPARRWDTSCWQADPRRARSALGWSPSVDLETGLGRTLAWLRASPELARTYSLEP